LNYHNRKIKALRSDNGGEYTSDSFSTYLRNSGISHKKTAPYSLEQNGVSERANRTLIGRAKAMILENKMNDNLWGEAIHTAVYLKNRSPTRSKNSTPYQLWTGQRPNLSHLIPFGTLAFSHIPKAKRSKWEKNGEECRVLGSEGTNQYRVLVGSKIKIVRDIRIVKDGGAENSGLKIQEEMPVEEIIQFSSESEDENGLEKSSSGITCTQASFRPRRENAGKFTSTRYYHEAFLATISLDSDEPNSYTEAVNSVMAPEWNIAIADEKKSITDNGTWEIVELPRGRTPVKCRWVFRVKRGAEGEVIRYKARLVAKGFTQRYGIDYLETFAPVVKLTSLCIILALAAVGNYEIDQTDIKTAYLLGKLEEEIYMEIPEGLVVEESSSSRKRKVCKLLKGLYGLKQSGRIWNQEWDRHLGGTCGFTRSKNDHAVYLKQRSEDYCWILIWVDDVLWIGPRAMVDEGKAMLAKQFPVTDLGRAHNFLGIQIVQLPRQITLNHATYIQKVLERFNMANAYTASIPLKPGTTLESLTGTRTHIQDGTPEVEDSDADETEYRSMIGSLMYLILCTRPNIAFTVGALSRYNNSPKESHMEAAKHLLRYVKKTSHLGLRLAPFAGKDLYPILNSDADWAGDLDTRKGTGGYACVLTEERSPGEKSNWSAVSWSSKRQQTVALSSTEAEYMALTQAAEEAIWVSRFIAELQNVPENLNTEDPEDPEDPEDYTPPHTTAPVTKIFVDNQGAVALAHKPEFHARTKHIAIQEHYVRENVSTGEIELAYLHTGDMIADCLTKNLRGDKVARFRAEMSLHKVGARAEEMVER